MSLRTSGPLVRNDICSIWAHCLFETTFVKGNSCRVSVLYRMEAKPLCNTVVTAVCYCCRDKYIKETHYEKTNMRSDVCGALVVLPDGGYLVFIGEPGMIFELTFSE